MNEINETDEDIFERLARDFENGIIDQYNVNKKFMYLITRRNIMITNLLIVKKKAVEKLLRVLDLNLKWIMSVLSANLYNSFLQI